MQPGYKHGAGSGVSAVYCINQGTSTAAASPATPPPAAAAGGAAAAGAAASPPARTSGALAAMLGEAGQSVCLGA